MRRLRRALAEAASQGRRTGNGTDPHRAARWAAVEAATALLAESNAETAAHSDDVDVISEGLSRRLGLAEEQVDGVLIAARMHDIGKVVMPAEMLEKSGPLDAHEWEQIRRHTVFGEEILLAVPELSGTARLVRYSHERWDGGGYPEGLAGEEIPLGSRIILCADAFHAIRSDRPYRSGRSSAEALAEIRACAGTQFDPTVVEALDEMAADFRWAAAGARSRRANRLMVLLLVLGVGALGTALAERSGLLGGSGADDPQSAPAIGGPVTGFPDAQAAIAAAATPDGPRPASIVAPAVPGQAVLGASCLPGTCPGSGGAPGLLTSVVPELGIKTTITGSPNIPVGAPLPGAGAPQGQGGSGEEEPGLHDHGVRDHGHGIGRGTGQGKGQGYLHGNGLNASITEGVGAVSSGKAAESTDRSASDRTSTSRASRASSNGPGGSSKSRANPRVEAKPKVKPKSKPTKHVATGPPSKSNAGGNGNSAAGANAHAGGKAGN